MNGLTCRHRTAVVAYTPALMQLEVRCCDCAVLIASFTDREMAAAENQWELRALLAAWAIRSGMRPELAWQAMGVYQTEPRSEIPNFDEVRQMLKTIPGLR